MQCGLTDEIEIGRGRGPGLVQSFLDLRRSREASLHATDISAYSAYSKEATPVIIFTGITDIGKW